MYFALHTSVPFVSVINNVWPDVQDFEPIVLHIRHIFASSHGLRALGCGMRKEVERKQYNSTN